MSKLNHRLSVAPMMGWTDRHYRTMMRKISPNSLLYSVMITSGALIHGQIGKHLDFDAYEQPVVLQLGGNDPDEMAKAARIAEKHGYDEININCGCPSDRVKKGAFGACLMAEPKRVAACVKAMKEKVAVDVTVKTRIGIDEYDSYEFLTDFVGTIADGGCSVFVIHARKAWLNGLSPKDNRTIPPLDYDRVYRLKRDFPHLKIILNGGLQTLDDIKAALTYVDGVMVGREAFHNPYWFATLERELFATDALALPSRSDVAEFMADYAARMIAAHDFVKLKDITNPLLGLYKDCPGARQWRQVLSENAHKTGATPDLILRARDSVEHAIRIREMQKIDHAAA